LTVTLGDIRNLKNCSQSTTLVYKPSRTFS